MDIRAEDHGSIVILRPTTPAGCSWMADHMPEDVQTWGIHGYVVEPRYVMDIVNGARDDGLEVTL